MHPQTVSLRPALLRGLLVMLGGTVIVTVGLHVAVQSHVGTFPAAGAFHGPVPAVGGVELWVLAGLAGPLVMALGFLLMVPALRRADLLCAERRQAEEALERARRYDRATGLPRRQVFEDLLRRSLAVGRRHGFRVGLVLLQIDGWQRCALRLTRRDSEAILSEILALINRNLRASDAMARIGTEEFAIVIGKVDGSDALAKLAERVLAKVDAVAARHAEAELSCSIGIAVASPDEEIEHHVLVRRADEALAEAEANGDTPWRIYTGARPAGNHLSVV